MYILLVVTYEDPAGSLVIGLGIILNVLSIIIYYYQFLEGASIEPPPQNTSRSQTAGLVLPPRRPLDTQMTVGEGPVGSETTTGYVSDISNPDSGILQY